MAANKQRVQSYKRKWKKNNRAQEKKYRSINKKEIAARDQLYYKRNACQRKDYIKEWKKLNPGKVREYGAIRHSRKRVNGGETTIQEWQALKRAFNFTCPSCGRPDAKFPLTLDHIVPVSKGGKGNADNIQPLCRSCNARKHTTIKDYRSNFIRTKFEEFLR